MYLMMSLLVCDGPSMHSFDALVGNAASQSGHKQPEHFVIGDSWMS